MTPRPSLPIARHYGWFAAGFLALAVYGSLVPLDFRPLPAAEAVARYRAAWRVPILVESRSDWLSNILLFLPLGFLLAGTLAVDRPRWAALEALVAVPAASAALSAAIEFAQVYFPSRTVSSRDVVAETIGGVIGAATWLMIGPGMTARARAGGLDGSGRAAWALPAYLLAMVLAHAIPLDITISPGELWGKVKAGMVAPIPFVGFAKDPAGAARRSADEAVSFLVAGLIAGRAAAWKSRSPWVAWAVGLVLASSIELLQFFVATRRCDATDLVVGTLAFLAGWLAGQATWNSADRRGDGRVRLAFLAGWLGILACSSWTPFDFNWDLGACLDKVRSIDFLPFADVLQGSPWVLADQVFLKLSLFFAFGLLLGGGWRTLVVAALIAATVEAVQVTLPGRVPSLSDLILEAGGAWLGQLASFRCPSLSGPYRVGQPSVIVP